MPYNLGKGLFLLSAATETGVHRCSEKKKKKNGLRSFAKYTVKHLCQSLCFNKVDSGTGVFLLIFVKLLRIPFLIEHLWCVLLHLKSFHCTVIILCALELV